MIDPIASPFLVPFDGTFRVLKARSAPPKNAPGKKGRRKSLARSIKRLNELQPKLYAHDRCALLLVFQAMDAAGKDSTIRAVMTGINPAGCQVYSFKQPSKEEQDHDFLWRTSLRLPERGRIGIFNRSYYESVLVVRVHPEYLAGEKLPHPPGLDKLWGRRYESIRDHERHLARNGTVVLKFWLNVSPDEQRARFLKRIDDPKKNWKFSKADLAERRLWPKYMDAYQTALNATSRPWAPWYAIPADDKPYMRMAVADIVARTLGRMDIEYPVLDKKAREDLKVCRKQLKIGGGEEAAGLRL